MMAVSFPPWWTPQVRSRVHALKIEDVLIARFSGLMDGVHPVSWLPTDEQTHQVLFEDSEAFLRIYRLDGEVDLENRRTLHRVQFAAITESRKVSADVIAFTQWLLYSYESAGRVVMPDGSEVALRFIRETQGPLLDPQQIRDARLVPVTVEVETPWPKGLPKIREHLDL